jgi:hypothetical protein
LDDLPIVFYLNASVLFLGAGCVILELSILEFRLNIVNIEDWSNEMAAKVLVLSWCSLFTHASSWLHGWVVSSGVIVTTERLLRSHDVVSLHVGALKT